MGCVQDSSLLFRELLQDELRPSECSFLGVLSAFDRQRVLTCWSKCMG